MSNLKEEYQQVCRDAGKHEEYLRSDGSVFCRQCGAELRSVGPWETDKGEPLPPQPECRYCSSFQVHEIRCMGIVGASYPHDDRRTFVCLSCGCTTVTQAEWGVED